MRDIDVRKALHATALAVHRNEPDTLVLDELGLTHGLVRVDVAVINGEIHGYEIKSESDTLERLPDQASVYNRVLDRVTLVASERHLKNARPLVPRWWGLKAAVERSSGEVQLRDVRQPRANPALDPIAVASLLWREEALEILEAEGAARGIRGKPRAALYARLAETLTLPELRDRVRHCLKRRSGWRADAQRT